MALYIWALVAGNAEFPPPGAAAAGAVVPLVVGLVEGKILSAIFVKISCVVNWVGF